MKKLYFENMGYCNVEIIGDRLIFTTSDNVISWSIEEVKKFMNDNIL